MSTPSTDLPYRDRAHAGQVLASQLMHYAGHDDVLVLALPRGGVPVAVEVARALHAPLDVFVVRKLGMPGYPEYAIGAIASGGVRVMNTGGLPVSLAHLTGVIEREEAELLRRELTYRGTLPPVAVEGRTVIVVDDGLATGSTMRAAARALRARHPSRLVLAAPVGAPETRDALREEADEVVCAATPSPFDAVGLWYRDFEQVSDDEVQALLAQSRQEWSAPAH